MKGVHLNMKLRMVRYIQTKSRRVRIVIKNAKGRRKNADIVKINRVVFVAETRNGFSKTVNLKGSNMDVSNFNGLMRDGENHLDSLRFTHLGHATRDKKKNTVSP